MVGLLFVVVNLIGGEICVCASLVKMHGWILCLLTVSMTVESLFMCSAAYTIHGFYIFLLIFLLICICVLFLELLGLLLGLFVKLI